MLQPSPAGPSRSAGQILEQDLGLVAGRIEIGERLARHLLVRQVDDEQRDVGFPPPRTGARRDHGDIGDRAVGHRHLGARELVPGDGGRDRPRRQTTRPLEQRQRADALPRSEIRQQPPLLLVVARQHDRLGRQIDRGRERHRRQRAAHFLGDHAEFEIPGAGPAEIFRHRHAEESHAGEALPQRAIVRRGAVEHRPHRLRRRMLGEIAPRLVPQLLLLI
jgi:hypothetical protein